MAPLDPARGEAPEQIPQGRPCRSAPPRSRPSGDVALLPADLRRWTPPEETYDLVLLCYLHVPWETMQRVVRASARAVAPGGLFLLVGHDRTNLDHGVGGPPDPDVLYVPEQITAELEGFEVERAEHVRRPVETEKGTREAIDNLVRAVRRCDV